MSRLLPGALVATASTLALAAPAVAAPPWGPPQTVATGEVRAPALAFNPAGGLGIATLGSGGVGTRLLPLREGQAAPVLTARDVASVEDGPLPYARTRTLALRRRAVGQATALGYSFGSPGGTVGGVRPLRTVALRPGEAELAVAPNGNAVIAFAEDRGGVTRVWLSVRRASSGRFSTPRVIRGSGSARSLAVSVNARGQWVVAYVLGAGAKRTVEARIGTVAGRVGSLQTVGRQLGIARLDAVVAATGRTTVAWTTHDGGEEQNVPSELRTNVAPAGRTTFAGEVVLDRAAPGALATEPGPPWLAAAPDGRTLVAYELSGRYAAGGTAADANAITPVRVSLQDAAARFAAPQELAADGVAGRPAARADGTFAVPYVTPVPLEVAPSALLVRLAAPGAAAFGPGELVADDAEQDAAVAFEAGPGGAPVVLYPRSGARGAAVARRAG